MSFALFIVYLLMVFVRPAEHFVELREVPFMEIASILALVGAALAILMGSRPPLRARACRAISILGVRSRLERSLSLASNA